MEERGWRRRRWSERGPAWQAVDVPAPRVVVCTSVTCVENIAAVVAGYRSLRVGANGKARCGTEQSWAQLLLFMLCGREADVPSDCVLPKVSWGLVSAGKLAGTGGSQEPSHQVCLFSLIHGQTPLLDHGLHFTCNWLLILILRVQPSSLLAVLWRPWQSSDSLFFFSPLFSVSKTIVKFLKRR